MRKFGYLFLLISMFFTSCQTNNKKPKSNEKIIEINAITSIGEVVGKIDIPIKKNDDVENIELIGEGAEKFYITNDGKIRARNTLQEDNSFSRIIIDGKVYDFKVKITYNSGTVAYTAVKIKVKNLPKKKPLSAKIKPNTNIKKPIQNTDKQPNTDKKENSKPKTTQPKSGTSKPKGYSPLIPASKTVITHDTTPPSKPTATLEVNTTNPNIQIITINGEAGATILVNGEKKGDINSSGKAIINIDITNQKDIKNFTISLRDTNDNVSLPTILQINRVNVDNALKSGDDSNITQEEIYQAIDETYASHAKQCASLLKKFYPNGLTTRPALQVTHVSLFNTKISGWTPIIASYKEGGPSQAYLSIKEFPNGTRAVISGLPIFDEVDMKSYYDDGVDKITILNVLKWLAQGKGSDSNNSFISNKDFLNKNIKIMWNDETSGWAYGGGWNRVWEVNKWINKNFKTTTGVTFQSNGLPTNWISTKHNSLPTDPNYDIYMTTVPNDTFLQTIFDHAKTTNAKGVFILIPPSRYYGQHDSITGTYVRPYFYAQRAYSNAPSLEAQCSATFEGRLYQLVSDLKNQKFHYTFPQAGGLRGQSDHWYILVTDGGVKKQIRNYVDGVDGTLLDDKLLQKLNDMIDVFRSFDYKNINIFADNNATNNRFYKLLLFLGDKYRENITYPMNKATTDNETFFKALFGDYTISYFRTTTPYQKRMGTFLNHDNNAIKYANNKALHDKQTISKSINFKTTKFAEASAAGAYAPPGKEFVVTRTDNQQNVRIWIRINFTRGGIGANNSMPFAYIYNRPHNVSSQWIEIKPSQSLHLSTPYGGPLYIQWSAQASDVKPVISLKFDNVLEHPFLHIDGSITTAEKNQRITNFTQKLSQNDNFSWIDVKTPFAELHSRAASLIGVVNNKRYEGNVTKFVNYLNKYLLLGNYHWAGFNGGGLDPLNPSVVDFCTKHNLDCTNPIIHQKPKIQHINSDAHALCGNACAGNPIDFDYGVDPLDQLPNHEMGHNLQRARTKLPNGGEVSNLISVVLTERSYALDLGRDYFGGWDQIRVAFDQIFNRLKIYNTNSSTPAIQGPLNDHFSGVAFHSQLMWSSSTDDNTSWDFYTKLWLHERLYTDAISSQAKWDANRDKLGFSTYTLDKARNINSIDYMTITSSYIAQKDYTDFFEMWMMKVSDDAKAQILATNYAKKQAKAFLHIQQNLHRDYLLPYEEWIMWPVHLPNHWIDMTNPSTAVYAP